MSIKQGARFAKYSQLIQLCSRDVFCFPPKKGFYFRKIPIWYLDSRGPSLFSDSQKINFLLGFFSCIGSRKSNESSDDNVRQKQNKRLPRDDPMLHTNRRGLLKQKMRTAKDSFMCTVGPTGRAKLGRIGRNASRFFKHHILHRIFVLELWMFCFLLTHPLKPIQLAHNTYDTLNLSTQFLQGKEDMIMNFRLVCWIKANTYYTYKTKLFTINPSKFKKKTHTQICGQ